MYWIAVRPVDGEPRVESAESPWDALEFSLAVKVAGGWAREFATEAEARAAVDGPPVKGQDGPFRDGRYRVWTVHHWRSYESLRAAGAVTVAMPEYSVSTSVLSRIFSSPGAIAEDDGRHTLNVRRHVGGGKTEPLFEKKYPTRAEADRAAWERGYTGLMLYLRQEGES